jgi:hypothetical protein
MGWQRSSTDDHGRCSCLRAGGSTRPERSEGASQARGCSGAEIGLAGHCRQMRSLVAQETGEPTSVRDRGGRDDRPRKLGPVAVTISSDGVVLQGAQHPSGRIADDLPLLVGQLRGAVFHNPGDPWQVMDHPWCEPLARRQKRRCVMGEEAAAGRAPRGGRCHAAQYGPRAGAGPPARSSFRPSLTTLPGGVAAQAYSMINVVSAGRRSVAVGPPTLTLGRRVSGSALMVTTRRAGWSTPVIPISW